MAQVIRLTGHFSKKIISSHWTMVELGPNTGQQQTCCKRMPQQSWLSKRKVRVMLNPITNDVWIFFGAILHAQLRWIIALIQAFQAYYGLPAQNQKRYSPRTTPLISMKAIWHNIPGVQRRRIYGMLWVNWLVGVPELLQHLWPIWIVQIIPPEQVTRMMLEQVCSPCSHWNAGPPGLILPKLWLESTHSDPHSINL